MKKTEKYKITFAFLILLLGGINSFQVVAKTGIDSNTAVVDLTHTLDENFPYIPVPGITFPFKKIPIATIEELGVAAFRWEIHEHIGTQIDAPSHFIANGKSMDEYSAREFVAPLVIIDISQRASKDADTVVTVEDVKNWEKRYGTIPNGAAVFMYSGWDSKVHDAKAFINADATNTMHFPGFAVETAEFLATERDVVGLGVDTLSFDPGTDKEYKTHKAWLTHGKWAVEAVANLEIVPHAGATVFVGATKVKGSTGGPVRLIAMYEQSEKSESSLNLKLFGKWRTAGVEPAGNNLFIKRQFEFFGQNRWQISVTFYSDESMNSPQFSFLGEGRYTIDSSSKVAESTWEARFRFDRKSLTLLSSDQSTLDKFGFENCNLTLNEAKDISVSGCASISSLDDCGQEFDLLKLTDDKLWLGARPMRGEDICSIEKRPVSLGRELIRD